MKPRCSHFSTIEHRDTTSEATSVVTKSSTNHTVKTSRSFFEPEPFYWVPETQVTDRLQAMGWDRKWLIGWRDITSATNERTVVGGIIPRIGSGDKFLLMFPATAPCLVAALTAVLSSVSFDFVARQKLGGNSLKLYVMQLPVASLRLLRRRSCLHRSARTGADLHLALDEAVRRRPRLQGQQALRLGRGSAARGCAPSSTP